MLSDCGGRGLRPISPSPTGANLLPADPFNKNEMVNNCKDSILQSYSWHLLHDQLIQTGYQEV